jgi:uncharacterized protein (DUF342 family)
VARPPLPFPTFLASPHSSRPPHSSPQPDTRPRRSSSQRGPGRAQRTEVSAADLQRNALQCQLQAVIAATDDRVRKAANDAAAGEAARAERETMAADTERAAASRAREQAAGLEAEVGRLEVALSHQEQKLALVRQHGVVSVSEHGCENPSCVTCCTVGAAAAAEG